VNANTRTKLQSARRTVFIGVFGVGTLIPLRFEFPMFCLEGIRNASANKRRKVVTSPVGVEKVTSIRR
jgi:hypothetical protein